jgi:phosphocarrier protein HPr
MINAELEIKNKLGLHARASALLVQTIAPFKSRVLICFKGREINAKSIMGLMLLAAGKGSILKLQIEGDDEQETMHVLRDLFERLFDEPQ